jgi:uncharacterized membrane protein YdjX (TVP38/TMEM64 family)
MTPPKAIKIYGFVLLLLLIMVSLLWRDQLDVQSLGQFIHGFGALAPVIFIVLYALATLCFLPGSMLTLMGGVLFGPLLGTIYNLSGATIGALLSFLVARYLAADWVEARSAGFVKRLKQGVENEGWRFVAFVRLVPIFPFNLMNYAFGLSRIRVLHYLLASAICMLPGAAVYTYLGYVGREVVSGGDGGLQKALLALALLSVMLFVPRFVARWRKPRA